MGEYCKEWIIQDLFVLGGNGLFRGIIRSGNGNGSNVGVMGVSSYWNGGK